MKKLLFITFISCSMFCSCGSNNAEKEKKDSIAAEAQADSMLKAEVASDSLKKLKDKSGKKDTIKE